jgi:hypothetical protein
MNEQHCRLQQVIFSLASRRRAWRPSIGIEFICFALKPLKISETRIYEISFNFALVFRNNRSVQGENKC